MILKNNPLPLGRADGPLSLCHNRDSQRARPAKGNPGGKSA
jgi:hypothetical protein